MSLLVGVLLLVGLWSHASAVSSGSEGLADDPPLSDELDFLFAGESNDEAVKVLAKALRRAGEGDWEVRSEKGAVVVLMPESGLFLIEPKMVLEDQDRIVIQRLYNGKSPANFKDRDFLSFVNKLNAEQNFGAWYADEDGDLWFRTVVTFQNRLGMTELVQATESMDFCVAMQVNQNPDAVAKWMK